MKIYQLVKYQHMAIQLIKIHLHEKIHFFSMIPYLFFRNEISTIREQIMFPYWSALKTLLSILETLSILFKISIRFLLSKFSVN